LRKFLSEDPRLGKNLLVLEHFFML
jgi:hypothetical protein